MDVATIPNNAPTSSGSDASVPCVVGPERAGCRRVRGSHLPVAVAQAEGILVGYLPGPAMRRIADLYPVEAKTDARDAAIIAEAARTMPHTLRTIALADEQAAELSMLCGFDDDLAQQATAASNRIRGLLTQIHPALERVIGPHLDHPAMAELLVKYPTPDAL